MYILPICLVLFGFLMFSSEASELPYEHDVAVISIWCNPRGGTQGISIKITVVVENQGLNTETFNVTVYLDKLTNFIGDEVILEPRSVDELQPGQSLPLEFVWVTSEALYGRYCVSAEASVVEGEIDTADNFLMGGDWIGGIYMPSYVRQQTEIITWAVMILLMCAPFVYLKSYWHL